MSGIEFIDPPPRSPRTTGRDRWNAVVAALRERPREWARVETNMSRGSGYNRASDIKAGRIAAFRDGKYDARFVLSPPDNTKGDLYVRTIE